MFIARKTGRSVVNYRKIKFQPKSLAQLQTHRTRYYLRIMATSSLQPPQHVRGMCELDREQFRKRVRVPCLYVRQRQLRQVLQLVKALLLKMENLRPVVLVTNQHEQEQQQQQERAQEQHQLRKILLNPQLVLRWDTLPTYRLNVVNVTSGDFSFEELELNYQNWNAKEILRSVLPVNTEGFTSYSRIGHIVHLNLRDHLLPYKRLIGQVLLDKVANCRTVVNKSSTIDHVYRFFEFELICGEPNYVVETKENCTVFCFDFSCVYWNSRLSTEHERIVAMLKPYDVLYDVFAGVGPFSVPAAKMGCSVMANDLNPDSFRWLQHNMLRNKCVRDGVLTTNLDGRDFIVQHVKPDLLRRWRQQSRDVTLGYNMHITMNLPAKAVEFLDVLRGLCEHETEMDFQLPDFVYPIVHVYMFSKGNDATTKSDLLLEVATNLRMHLTDDELLGVHFVRNVSPNKNMFRVTFRLNRQILTTSMNLLAQPHVNGEIQPANDNDNDNGTIDNGIGETDIETKIETADVADKNCEHNVVVGNGEGGDNDFKSRNDDDKAEIAAKEQEKNVDCPIEENDQDVEASPIRKRRSDTSQTQDDIENIDNESTAKKSCTDP